MQAVARFNHPLLRNQRKLSRVDLIQHVSVIIEGNSSGESRSQPRLPSQRSVPVSTVESAIEAVRSGFCFGWLPLYRIQPYIDSGDLVPLNLAVGSRREARFHLVCRDLDASSQELRSLAELLGLNRELDVI